MQTECEGNILFINLLPDTLQCCMYMYYTILFYCTLHIPYFTLCALNDSLFDALVSLFVE